MRIENHRSIRALQGSLDDPLSGLAQAFYGLIKRCAILQFLLAPECSRPLYFLVAICTTNGSKAELQNLGWVFIP